MELTAVEYGSQVGRQLCGVGRVIGVYPKAINIQLASGLCLSIVTNQVDPAPNRVVVENQDLCQISLRTGELIRVDGDGLYHHRVTILLPKALWKPVQLPAVRIADYAPGILRKVLGDGSGAALVYLGLSFGDNLDQAVAERVWTFRRTPGSGCKLLGLGKGLTPSGDDILTGYLAVGQRTGQIDQDWSNSIIAQAKTLTNPLSYTALYLAGSGLVQGYLERVLQALKTTPQNLASAASDLVGRVGSTSGSDLLLGVLVFCEGKMR